MPKKEQKLRPIHGVDVALPFICGMLPLIGDRVSRSFFKPVVTSQADFHAASPSDWQLANQREAIIRPLAEADRLSRLQVDRAAKILGLGRSVAYQLIEIPLIKGNFQGRECIFH